MQLTPRARSFIVGTPLIGALAFAGCASISDGPVTEAETASVAPTPAATEDLTTTVELGDGHLTFEIPETWDAEFEDLTAALEADERAAEFNGRSAQRAVITSPDETARVDVFTNMPWPDIVAVDADEVQLLHAEPLDMGYEPAEDGYGMWLRAVIGENPEFTDERPTYGAYDERFEGERYLLVVAPYFADDGVGPPDELDGGVAAFRFPFSDTPAGDRADESITIAAGTIRQSVAEDLTGEEGLDAMRAVVDTEEYAELIDIVQSFRVHVEPDAIQP
ncbi:hypothetical protein GCM10023190_21700 [Enteractinococcus fodinae]|uniref:Uncharacterized protein n=1 Tax=Enteractinococcus fodinae TaxID=684663 RepID=A0ABU2B3V5_9MICC|nr:hypothetical protein [Enteractinococcus fodinae]MDR7348071.1 hypothetical protein [Enteractinococcus fodinae]